MSAVKDGDFGIRGNPSVLGAWLNCHRLAESRRDGARLLNHRHNGGGLGHADNFARLAGILDNVAGSQGVKIGNHKNPVVKVTRGARRRDSSWHIFRVGRPNHEGGKLRTGAATLGAHGSNENQAAPTAAAKSRRAAL